MRAAAQLAAFADVAGPDAIERHPPLALDGVAPEVTWAPEDGDALSRGLVALGERGLAAWVRGGGSRGCLGNSASAADVILSSRRLGGVLELDASEGVCRVGAGTTLRELRQAVRASGWELPLEAPGQSTTVGGVIAAAAIGPRASGFGIPRDLVLGMDVVLASGERTRCGGRVVKNVTGYDLGKLYVGSLGTLGVIEAAWLRLRPLPERTAHMQAVFEAVAPACRFGVQASRRPTARAAAIVCAAGGPWRVVVELAGDDASVARDLEALLGLPEARECTPKSVDEVELLQAAVPEPSGLRFRLSALSSRLEDALTRLSDRAVTRVAYPGVGLVFAGFPLPPEPDDEAAGTTFDAVIDAAREAGGHAICEAAPPWAKRGRDVFGPARPELAIMRSLKSRFDPEGVLNPGRFAGKL